MSTTATRMSLAEAEAIAERFTRRIESCCERVMAAGSIRRRSPDVGDIEIVAVPTVAPTLDLFGDPTVDVDWLARQLEALRSMGDIEKRETNGHSAWGPKYKRLSFEGAPFDLFSCDAARWGLILAIRTGPALYSQQLVTTRDSRTREGQRLGLMAPHLRVVDGWLTYRVSGQRIDTPEEVDFYREIGLSYVAPGDRR